MPTPPTEPPATSRVAHLLRWDGRVQGVGFRATVEVVAHNRGVTGWVRNRTDGTVEALLIGTAATTADAIRAIAAERRGYIQTARSRPIDPPPAWPPGFVIARTTAADEWPTP